MATGLFVVDLVLEVYIWLLLATAVMSWLVGFGVVSTEHRAVVVLHHYLGLGLEEIAAVVGVPAGTARSRLHYALQKLRTALEPVEPATPVAAESSR